MKTLDDIFHWLPCGEDYRAFFIKHNGREPKWIRTSYYNGTSYWVSNPLYKEPKS